MRIGIDISQTAYENTGVGNYLSHLVSHILTGDRKNDYVLFFSSLRGKPSVRVLNAIRDNPRAKIKTFKIPPTVLNVLWNNIHVVSIESFIGEVDLFITSDWTEPPARRAKKATIIYDLIVYRHPEETDQSIITIQKMKLSWVKKESNFVFCISEATKNDIQNIMSIESNKIKVIYPGL